jgi:hypothetical protein
VVRLTKRLCLECQTKKPESAFYFNKAKGKFFIRCKECVKAMGRERYATDENHRKNAIANAMRYQAKHGLR